VSHDKEFKHIMRDSSTSQNYNSSTIISCLYGRFLRMGRNEKYMQGGKLCVNMSIDLIVIQRLGT
jgi:hypothetical protein